MANRQPRKPAKREKHAAPEGGGATVKLDWNSFMLICERLAETGSKYRACEDLGFNYNTVITAVKAREDAGDDSWRELWNESYDKFRDSLEQAARVRARDGVPVEFKINSRTGEVVPTKVEFSDRLMEVMLKGHFPERYRERIAVSGTVGLEPVDVFANLSHKAKREIRRIIMEDLEEQRQLAAAASSTETIEGSATTALEDLRGEEQE